MIECRVCHTIKESGEFYTTRRTGLPERVCKACRRLASRAYYHQNREKCLEYFRAQRAHKRESNQEYKRRWNLANLDKIRAYKTRHYEANRSKVKDRARQWERENPERARMSKRASQAVQYALRTGKLVRPDACEQADDTCLGILTAAHEDYSKPLGVRWLCLSHHRRWDQVQPKTKPKNEDDELWPEE